MRIFSTSTGVKCHKWTDGTLHSSYELSGTHSHISSISCAKDSGWVVVVPNQGYAEVVTFNETTKSLLTIKEVQNPTSACFPNTTKRYIALGTSTGQIMTYDIKMRLVKKKFPYAPSTFFKIEYTPNDKYLVGGCDNGSVLLYNTISANACGSFKVPNSRTLTDFKCHPIKNNYISACSDEGIVCIWDLNRSKSLMSIEAHKLPVTNVAFMSYNYELLASIGMDRDINILDMRSNKSVHSVRLKKSPTAISCGSDGVSVAIGFNDGKIESFDLRNMNETVFKFKHNDKITSIAFEPIPVSNASVLSLQEDANNEIEEKSSKQCSFGQMVFSSPLHEIPEVLAEEYDEGEIKDSFLEAIGTSTGSIKDSPANRVSRGRISDGIRMLINSRPNFFQDSPNNTGDSKTAVKNQMQQSNLLQASNHTTDSKTSFTKKQIFQASTSNNTIDCKTATLKNPIELSKYNMNSTPVDADKNFPAFQVSPIVPKQFGLINAAEIKETVREVIREEMHEYMNAFKKEIKFQIMDVMHYIGKLSIDTHMSHMKEFNELEEKLDKLREDLECGSCSDSGCG